MQDYSKLAERLEYCKNVLGYSEKHVSAALWAGKNDFQSERMYVPSWFGDMHKKIAFPVEADDVHKILAVQEILSVLAGKADLHATWQRKNRSMNYTVIKNVYSGYHVSWLHGTSDSIHYLGSFETLLEAAEAIASKENMEAEDMKDVIESVSSDSFKIANTISNLNTLAELPASGYFSGRISLEETETAGGKRKWNISSPHFLYPDGDHMLIFVVDTGNGWQMTDLGETLAHLSTTGRAGDDDWSVYEMVIAEDIVEDGEDLKWDYGQIETRLYRTPEEAATQTLKMFQICSAVAYTLTYISSRLKKTILAEKLPSLA